MRKVLSLFVVLAVLFLLTSCDSLPATPREANSNSNMPKPANTLAEAGSTIDSEDEKNTSVPPEKIEIEVTKEQILKFYDYFTNIAPGFVQIPLAMDGDFSELRFDSPTEISDEGMIIYAIINLLYKGLHDKGEDGYVYWKTNAVISEIERGFAREVKDFDSSGFVNEIPKDGILKSTGWDVGEGFFPKLIQLTQWEDGTFTGVFEFYSVLDYLMEAGPFDIKEEIVKDYSTILNSTYCISIEKTITFIEKHDDDGFYLQFVSAT